MNYLEFSTKSCEVINVLLKRLEQYFGYIIFFSTLLTLLSTLFWVKGYDSVVTCLGLFSVVSIYPGIFIVTVLKIKKFDKLTNSISALLMLYFEVLLAFSSVYIWLIIFSNNQAFCGFDSFYVISVTKESFELKEYLIGLVVFLIDVFHFSVVTATTLGYGDVYPKSPVAKIFVDFHVLFSIGISIFGVGKYFESRSG